MYFAIFPDGMVKQLLTNGDEDDVVREYMDRPEVTILKIEGDVGVVLDCDDWHEVPKEYL